MRSDYCGVKFYGENDLSTGYVLQLAEPILNNFDSETTYTNLNEVIELYNVKLLLDKGLRLTSWNDEGFSKYQNISNSFPKTIGRFFANINSVDLVNYYKLVEGNYIDDFWAILDEYKIYKNLNSDDFFELLNQKFTPLYCVLKYKNIVYKFGKEILSLMALDINHTELIIQYYLEKRENKASQLFFPSDLTVQLKLQMIETYIESYQSNFNYIKLIANAQSTTELPITDIIRLKAIKKIEELSNKYFEKNSGYEYGVELSFSSLPNKKKEEKFINGTYYCKYSKEFLDNNLDYRTLLINFISLFEYTDAWMRCSFVSKNSELGILEKHLDVKGKNDYVIGVAFNLKKMISSAQMSAYCHELECNNIKIELIFKWFFETYLIQEYGIKDFIYIAPSPNTTYLEKCRTISTEIDSILKQFRMFCEYGSINRKLLELSSEHIILENIPSLLNNKYVYKSSSEIFNEMWLLCSDQSDIHFIKKSKDKYNTFLKLILEESISVNDFQKYQTSAIEWLIERNLLFIKPNGILKLNLERAFILRELFQNEVLCMSYCDGLNNLIVDLQKSGDLKCESTLFSIPEQNYLDFMLNKSKYSNGYDLRNKYIHGTQSLNSTVHEEDYKEFLKIMVLIILKIDEECRLKQNTNRKIIN